MRSLREHENADSFVANDGIGACVFFRFMPTFPTYRGALPACLRLFQPVHYALLAYWIYFRPTALKCYFHQAMPDLYDQKKPIGFFRKWGNPAFRNLFVMLPVVCTTISFSVSIPLIWICARILQSSMNWEQWFNGVTIGIGLGMAIGLALGMVGGVVGGAALSAIVGVTFGVIVGVIGGVSLSTAFSLSFADMIERVIIAGAVGGVLSGAAFTLDIEIGLALSFAFGIMAALSFGAEFIAEKLLNIRLGALVAREMMSGAFVVGALRGIFYPIEWLLAAFSIFQHRLHPVRWDELTVLPLPWTQFILLRELQRDEHAGLRLLTDIARNLFRRAALRAALYRYAHKHPTPLHFLYGILSDPAMYEYLLAPVTEQQRKHHVSVRYVLLGELALQPVEATQYPRIRRSARWLNLRKRRSTPLTQFAEMLYELLDEHVIEQETFDLAAYREKYNGLAAYPDGGEIALSYDTMAAFLAYRHISDLSGAEQVGRHLTLRIFFRDAIRPPVLKTLAQLGHIGAVIAKYQQSADHTTQLSALAHATGDLNGLNDYVHHHVMAPEQFLLRRIIRQWEQIIIAEIGSVGKEGKI